MVSTVLREAGKRWGSPREWGRVLGVLASPALKAPQHALRLS